MKPELLLEQAIAPALRLLPLDMGSPAAMALMLAIALQESRATFRRQINGPARGYWQFEQGGGVRGVLTHPASLGHVRTVLALLDYRLQDAEVPACYAAIEHNDILAAAFARLLLWTLPMAMPDVDNPQKGWDRYIAAWRPGKPHRETWDAYFEQAWGVVIDATRDT